MSTIINENLIIKENNTILKDVTVNGSITVEADNVSIVNCTITADGDAITSSGKYLIVKNNKINAKGKAISLLAGSQNCLVAQNETNSEISATEAYNCSVILNSADRFVGRGCTNLYVIDNTLDENNEFVNNKHLICDGNKCTTVTSCNNTLSVGDTIQDVTVRPEFGANEDLLPHTNKDLFMGMERRLTVTDPAREESLPLNEYIPSEARKGEVVIVPPGAYTVSSLLELGEEQSNTVIYAYGVYLEATDYVKCLQIKGASSLQLKGITIGYTKQSAGQMQILDMLGDNK